MKKYETKKSHAAVPLTNIITLGHIEFFRAKCQLTYISSATQIWDKELKG
jgi:hypothetical protein